MPNLKDADADGGLTGPDPAATASSDPPVRLIERDPTVRLALEALGTDLDDAGSRNPDGFFRTLRSDAWRLALHDLLNGLGRARVIVLLDWISRTAEPSAMSSMVGTTNPNEPLLLRLMRQERRELFDRLLSPTRLATLLGACMPEQHTEGA